MFEDWTPPNDSVVDLYFLYEANGRNHLPMDGGLMDQDEAVIHDLAVLSQMSSITRAEVRENG